MEIFRKDIPQKIALYEDDNKYISYGELQIKVDEISEHFKENSLVFLICSNTIECIAIYLACIRKNAVPLLLAENINETKLTNLIKTYSPSYICSKKKFDLKSRQLDIIKSLLNAYCIYEEKGTNIQLNNELAILLTTSGSTGSPKIARISKENITSNTSAIIDYLNITENDSHITTLPLCYTYGLSCVHTHLKMGGTIYLNDYSVIEREFWNFYRNCKPTSISGVPYTYELINRIGLDNLITNKLRCVTQAGGKMSKDLHEKMSNLLREHKISLFTMYGQTEATARMSYVPTERCKDKQGSIGIPIKGGKFSLNNINTDGIGELVYTGKNVFMGYAYNKGDLEKGNSNNNKLYTGDIGYIDGEGYAYLISREKRFAKINGVRIDLDYIQDLIVEVFTSCATISDDKTITVYLEKDNQAKEDEIQYIRNLKRYLLERTSIQPTLYKIKILKRLPRTSSGKIAYGELSNVK